jgi:hypothetical protein
MRGSSIGSPRRKSTRSSTRCVRIWPRICRSRRRSSAWPTSRALGGHLKPGHRWTGQNRPKGRALKAACVVARSCRESKRRADHGVRRNDGRGGAGVCGHLFRRRLGDTKIAPPIAIVAPEPNAGLSFTVSRLLTRVGRPAAACASSWGRRSGRGHGGADGRAAPRRRRCRPGACPSLRRDDST